MSKLEKQPPKWHAEVAAELNREGAELATMGEEIKRRRTRFGFMLIWIKEMGKADDSIPHGHFGKWLEKHCPKLSHSTAGEWITQARSLIELLGWQNSGIRNFEIPPHKLLLINPSELKGENKSHYEAIAKAEKKFQAVTKYAQTVLKDDAVVNQRGQLKGSKGLTREQRAAAKAKAREADIIALRLRLKNFFKECDELADAAHAGNPEIADTLREGRPSLENLTRFVQRVDDARSARRAGH